MSLPHTLKKMWKNSSELWPLEDRNTGHSGATQETSLKVFQKCPGVPVCPALSTLSHCRRRANAKQLISSKKLRNNHQDIMLLDLETETIKACSVVESECKWKGQWLNYVAEINLTPSLLKPLYCVMSVLCDISIYFTMDEVMEWMGTKNTF